MSPIGCEKNTGDRRDRSLTGRRSCVEAISRVGKGAEGGGFEPPVGCPTFDFESSALNRTQPPFQEAADITSLGPGWKVKFHRGALVRNYE